MFYILDFQEQGLGRIFWYAYSDSPVKFKTLHEIDEEQWEYLSIGLEAFHTYKEAREKYPFLPNTFVPPTKLYIRWT